MTTAAAAIVRELERRSDLIELLHADLANVSAVAELLKSKVTAESGSAISSAAAGMAVRRYLRSGEKIRRPRPFPRHIEILTRSQIYEIAIQRNLKAEEIARRVRKEIGQEKSDFLSVIEGSYEIVFFTSQRNKEKLLHFIGKSKKTTELDNLGCVTVNWPPVSKSVPGIYYRITRALAFNGISIQSFHTVGAEMMIFVEESALRSAYEALERVLNHELQG